MNRPLVILFPLAAALASCAHLPPASQEEIYARDQWAQKVSPTVRQQVHAEAERHTNWGEKRKVQFEISRYQHVYQQEQKKTRATATRPATAPAK